MKKIEEPCISYFNPPVRNTKPARNVSLAEVHEIIVSDRLKGVTERIRAKKAKKDRDLPSVTFSGIFEKRCEAGLKEYSSLIVFDIDRLDFASTLKWRLSIDVFLKVQLAFISPGGAGLKFVVCVLKGRPEEHELYFRAVARYMKGTFGIEVDQSGKDKSRLCFLCHDPAAYYNPMGYVERDALLRLLPAPAPAPAVDACRDAIHRVSTPTPAPAARLLLPLLLPLLLRLLLPLLLPLPLLLLLPSPYSASQPRPATGLPINSTACRRFTTAPWPP